MKKLISNPMSIVFLVFLTIIIGSNVCCTGKASNKGINVSADANETQAAEASAPGSVMKLTEGSFDAKTGTGVALVDFWATWCKPCRMQGPIIEEVGKEMAGKVTVGKLDIDENPSIANKYGVQSIPTMLIFKDGIVVGQFVGITAKEDILSALNKQLK
jgi:thioredoxin 1